MRVRLTPEARASYRAIREYLKERSPEAADRFSRRFRERSRGIARLPHSGRMVPEFRAENVREIIEPPYRIWYAIRDDEVEILAIFHGARDTR